MKRTLWQIAIAIRALYGVNLTSHSYEAPHSKRLWGYPYVEKPIANTYELDHMANSHNYISERCGVNLSSHSYKAPHSKELLGYPYVKYPIANTYEADPTADSHSYQSSVLSEPYVHSNEAPHNKKLWGYDLMLSIP